MSGVRVPPMLAAVSDATIVRRAHYEDSLAAGEHHHYLWLVEQGYELDRITAHLARAKAIREGRA